MAVSPPIVLRNIENLFSYGPSSALNAEPAYGQLYDVSGCDQLTVVLRLADPSGADQFQLLCSNEASGSRTFAIAPLTTAVYGSGSITPGSNPSFTDTLNVSSGSVTFVYVFDLPARYVRFSGFSGNNNYSTGGATFHVDVYARHRAE